MSELTKRIVSWVLGHLPLILLPFLCLLAYYPAVHHDFVMDDTMLVIANPYITSWKFLPQMLTEDTWNVWGHYNYWRPLFYLSLALDYSLWGLSPFGFHLTNLILHAINTVLLYSLGQKLHSTRCAVFASLLFALHPIQAHAVNVISTRGDLLAALFALLSVKAFLSKRTSLFVTCLVLALFSKETSMVLPLVFLIPPIMFQKGKLDLRHPLAFAILGIYIAARLSLGFSFSLTESIFSYDASSAQRLLLVFKALALYFLAIFNLFETPHPFWTVEVPTSLFDPYVIGGASICGLLLGAIWKSFRKEPLVAFGLAWFFIYFLPISNLKELNQPMAEHWLYLPMIGLSLAFGAILSAPPFRLPKAYPVRAGVTAAVFGFLVFAALVVREKTKIYKDDESFLVAAVRANPQVARLYAILGSTFLAKQDIRRAKESYAKALNLDPSDFLANYRTGFLFHQAGQYEEAKIYLEKVVRSNPARLSDIAAVAHAWEMLGQKQKALSYYREAFDLNPHSPHLKQKVATLETLKSPQDR